MHLDFETMVARVAWQFEFPYALAVNRDDDTGSEVDGTNGTAAARGDKGVVSTSDPIEGYNLSFVEARPAPPNRARASLTVVRFLSLSDETFSS